MTDQALQTKILEKSMLNTYTQQFNVVIDANLCLSLDENYSFSRVDLICNMRWPNILLKIGLRKHYTLKNRYLHILKKIGSEPMRSLVQVASFI